MEIEPGDPPELSESTVSYNKHNVYIHDVSCIVAVHQRICTVDVYMILYKEHCCMDLHLADEDTAREVYKEIVDLIK